MNAVGNQRLGVAYKPDDDLYNTKYEVEHTADQGYTPNFPIPLDGRKVACRIGDVKAPQLAVQQKYAISIRFRRKRFDEHSVRVVYPALVRMLCSEFCLAVRLTSTTDARTE